MSAAEKLWRETSDARKRTVASIWPQLAAALEGGAGPAQDTPPPVCEWCTARPARGTANGKPICARCVGRIGPDTTMVLERKSSW